MLSIYLVQTVVATYSVLFGSIALYQLNKYLNDERRDDSLSGDAPMSSVPLKKVERSPGGQKKSMDNHPVIAKKSPCASKKSEK